MRILGIDYGTKRIGLAISDEDQTLAFPKGVLANDDNLLDGINAIIAKEDIGEIVLGESTDFSGAQNLVGPRIEGFVRALEQKFSLPMRRQKEFLTTVEARRYHPEGGRVDASAAALILQRYLDQKNNQK